MKMKMKMKMTIRFESGIWGFLQLVSVVYIYVRINDYSLLIEDVGCRL